MAALGSTTASSGRKHTDVLIQLNCAERERWHWLFLLATRITYQLSLHRELTFSTANRFADILQDVFFIIVSRNRDRVICCCRDQLRTSWRWITMVKIEVVAPLQCVE